MFDWLIDSCTYVHDFLRFRGFFFIHSLQLLLPAVIVASIMSVTSRPACGGRTWCPHQFEVSSAVGIAGQGGRDSFAKGGENAFHIFPFLASAGFVFATHLSLWSSSIFGTEQHPTTRTPNSSSCTSSSQKAPHPDISETESGIIDPLVSIIWTAFMSPPSPPPSPSPQPQPPVKAYWKGIFLQVYSPCVEIVDKAGFHFGWYWYLVLGTWWYLTSATITVSVSSSKLLFPLPELFRKLVMRSQFQSQALKSAKLWYMLIFNLPVYDVKQEDHKAEQSQHSIGINGIPGSRSLEHALTKWRWGVVEATPTQPLCWLPDPQGGLVCSIASPAGCLSSSASDGRTRPPYGGARFFQANHCIHMYICICIYPLIVMLLLQFSFVCR